MRGLFRQWINSSFGEGSICKSLRGSMKTAFTLSFRIASSIWFWRQIDVPEMPYFFYPLLWRLLSILFNLIWKFLRWGIRIAWRTRPVITKIFFKAQCFRLNISKSKKLAFQSRQWNPVIVILLTGNGISTVVFYSKEHNTKISIMLKYSFYTPLVGDSTPQIE